MRYSILIPVFNAERYIKDCLESIYNQSIGNYELIIFNDASTDKSLDIILGYKDKFKSKLKIINSQENKGVVFARKKLFEEAKGKYIVIVDADDYLEDNMLFQIDNIINKKKCDLVIFEYNTIYGLKGLKKIKRKNRTFNKNMFCEKKEDMEKMYQAFASGKINPLWRKVFKKKLLREFKKEYVDNNITLGEDLYLSQLIFRRAKKIYYTNEILYNYVKNKESMTHTKKILNSFNSLIKVAIYIDKWIDEWKIDKQKYFYNTLLRNCIKLVEELSVNEEQKDKRKEQYKIILEDKFITKILCKCNDKKILEYFNDDFQKIENIRRYLKWKKILKNRLLK